MRARAGASRLAGEVGVSWLREADSGGARRRDAVQPRRPGVGAGAGEVGVPPHAAGRRRRGRGRRDRLPGRRAGGRADPLRGDAGAPRAALGVLAAAVAGLRPVGLQGVNAVAAGLVGAPALRRGGRPVPGRHGAPGGGRPGLPGRGGADRHARPLDRPGRGRPWPSWAGSPRASPSGAPSWRGGCASSAPWPSGRWPRPSSCPSARRSWRPWGSPAGWRRARLWQPAVGGAMFALGLAGAAVVRGPGGAGRSPRRTGRPCWPPAPRWWAGAAGEAAGGALSTWAGPQAAGLRGTSGRRGAGRGRKRRGRPWRGEKAR